MNVQALIVGLTLNYRDAQRTLRCVRTLLDQDVSQVLVWDNSGDGGRSVADLIESVGNDAKVSIEHSSTNLGFARGVNRGIEWIIGRFPEAWVLLVNNDAHLLPGAVVSLAQALTAHPQAVIAYPDINHNGTVTGTMYYQRHTGLLTRRPLPGSFPHASGCCQLIVVQRSSVPLFDEEFFMYGEDAELGARLGASQMIHVPQTLVFHEGSASSGLGSAFYEARMVAAHRILARKLAHGPLDYALLLSMRAITLTVRSLVRSVRFRSFIPLRALTEGLRIARNAGRNINPVSLGHYRHWSFGLLEQLSCCPACATKGTSSRTFIRRDDRYEFKDLWTMCQCAGCGSIYLNPRPDDESLPRAYSNYYTHTPDVQTISAGSQRSVLNGLINGYLQHRFGISRQPVIQSGALVFSLFEPLRLKLEHYGRHLPRLSSDEHKTLLDVGCGNGAFLQRARNMGWNVTGCEPDGKAAAAGRRQSLQVLHGDVFDPRLDGCQFDSITMNHVLEHLSSPVSALNRVEQLLAPGGVLWVALPNPDAVGLKVFGANWKGLHPPFHMLIPSQRILKTWLKQAGFNEVRFLRRGAQSSLQWNESIQIAAREGGGVLPAWVFHAVKTWADLLATLTSRWGEETVLVARKTDR